VSAAAGPTQDTSLTATVPLVNVFNSQCMRPIVVNRSNQQQQSMQRQDQPQEHQRGAPVRGQRNHFFNGQHVGDHGVSVVAGLSSGAEPKPPLPDAPPDDLPGAIVFPLTRNLDYNTTKTVSSLSTAPHAQMTLAAVASPSTPTTTACTTASAGTIQANGQTLAAPGPAAVTNRSSAELADIVDNDLATADKFDNSELFGVSTLRPGPGACRQRMITPRRSRGAGAVGLPSPRPSMDALTQSLQRDVSMDSKLGRDLSLDWLNGRRSRDQSFENGLLSNTHRDMSMSIEFNGRLRSHLSMEMQLSGPRGGAAPHNGVLVDGHNVDCRAASGSELQNSMSALFAPIDGVWGTDPAMGTSVVGGSAPAIDSCGAGGASGSALMIAGGGGHISRSKFGMSKDDLMLDLHPSSQSQLGADQLAYGDRTFRLPSGSSQHDFRDIRPYL
jgi:hypothetical protein